MEPSDLIEVLGGRHFSMPERVARGMWPHPPMALDDLITRLAPVVASRRWFPRSFQPAKQGEIVADVAAVECRGPTEFVVHLQASGPTGFTVAGYVAQKFDSAAKAAEYYLRSGLRLPGDLDGWKVVE